MTATTAIDRANKALVQTTDLPDSSVDEQSVTVNGLLVSSRSSSNLTTTYAYDALERQASVTDPRTGATTIAYFASGTGKTGQVHTVTDAVQPTGNATTFDYDPATGRRTSVTNALGKATTYAYNDRGQITAVRGDASYPLDYAYDAYGRMVQLKTYRDEQLTTPDITTWAYHEPTGLLTSKTYADAKAVSYTYSSDGKLATRTWARPGTGEQLFALYSYHAATAELAGIDYSDSTPDVAFTYNRLGQQATVTDVVGTRTFSYNAALQLTSEAIAGGLYSKTITRAYQDGTGVPGRYAGVAIPADGYSVSHGYDAYGRPGSMTAGTDTFTYSYLANSDLLSTIQYPSSISAARAYEPNRDLITSVENSVLSEPSVVISRYDYTNDAIGRRTAMAKSGTAFSLADLISYGYNDRSEVTSAVSANLATYDYGYDFDPIGNRLTSTSKETGTPVTRNYTSNVLNQYTAIDNPTASPTHDDDGNMTSLPVSTGTWACTWDAENRLTAMEKSDQRLEFAYDYASRRVEKKTFTGSTGNWTLASHLRFVYDGFLQIEKLDGTSSNALLITRIWTGVEGYDRLISETHIGDPNVTYYALCDANKNITGYLDASGAIIGHYEYSPFGQITRSSGASPGIFDFRFSSEFFEQETGLVYYNFRYYSPELGRWLGRDPIGERGEVNLYIMVRNTLINSYDLLGLHEFVVYPRPDRPGEYGIGFTTSFISGPEVTGQNVSATGYRDLSCPPPNCIRYVVSCSVDVRINGHARITELPILIGGVGNLTEEERERWEMFYNAVLEHERGHLRDFEKWLERSKERLSWHSENCSLDQAVADCFRELSTYVVPNWYNVRIAMLSVAEKAYHIRVGDSLPPPIGFIPIILPGFPPQRVNPY
jgi:RHS repeat-associated protein